MSLEAGRQQHIGSIIAVQRKGFAQLARVAVSPVKVGFVDKDDVREFEQSRYNTYT